MQTTLRKKVREVEMQIKRKRMGKKERKYQ